MGGIGSGNHYYRADAKAVVEDYLHFRIDDLRECGAWKQRSGTTTWSRCGRAVGAVSWWLEQDESALHLYYSVRGEPIEERIELVGRIQRTGGFRYYLSCPSCSSVVRILYGGRLFRCRACHNLTYRSCQEPHKWDRLLSSISKDMSAEYGYTIDGRTVGYLLDSMRREAKGRTRRIKVSRSRKKTNQ